MTDFLAQIQLDKKKIILILAISAIIAVVDIAFVIKLQIKGLSSVSAKAAKLDHDLKDLSKDLALMQQAQKRPVVAKKVKKIISEADIPSLLQDIDTIAKNNKVKILQITPGSADVSKDNKSAIGNFIPVFVSLELNCGYHNLGAFINEMENHEKFIAVEALKITPITGNYQQERADLVLKTYVKK